DRWTDIHSKLIFWEVLFNKLSDSQIAEIKSDPGLKSKNHYIDSVRKYAPHTLSEPEEKILSATSSVSGSAFARLFDETVNGIQFSFTDGGKETLKTESEILALLHSPSQDVRKRASVSLAEGLNQNAKLITYIYNMVLADHRMRSKLRGFTHPSQSRNMANETDLPTLTNLIDSCVQFYPEVEKYYRLKTKLLGLNQMNDYDRYAPLSDTDEKIPFEECRRMVVDSYTDFDPEFGRIAGRFFEERWIDAEMRPGKRGGGFCCSVTPDHHPFILVNYSGSLRDVLTVAHEVGHGIHQFLSAKAGILECDAPLTMAETASVFGEMLTFDRLLKRVKNPEDRLALRCGQIDDQIATIFRQIAMTRFELKCHESGMEKGELAEEDFNRCWVEVNRELYGESILLSDSYRHGWKYIPHFIHTPFYCYAYSFAQLFVLALFSKYKNNTP
ncbi:MAG: M3 family oligoendopeptidase, partial [Candidatus Omnitrophica bacterium]|nr:M3 family oligoendopeptidase [Candidatus Omnitrophota bacterium]